MDPLTYEGFISISYLLQTIEFDFLYTVNILILKADLDKVLERD